MDNYDLALSYFPDHPNAIIGISGILMDIYEEKIPAEEPRPLLGPSQTSNHGSPLNVVAPTVPVSSSTTAPNPSAEDVTGPSREAQSRPRPRQDRTPAELNRLAARDRAVKDFNTDPEVSNP